MTGAAIRANSYPDLLTLLLTPFWRKRTTTLARWPHLDYAQLPVQLVGWYQLDAECLDPDLLDIGLTRHSNRSFVQMRTASVAQRAVARIWTSSGR